MQPLISVIIPVYNAEKYLKVCVDSVLGQTYSNLEIILVDDGSSDNSPAICDDYAAEDKRCKVIHKKNGGVCTARNMGLDNASGEYVAFIDADDYFFSDSIEKLYLSADESCADIAIGWKTNVTDKGAHLGCPYKIERGAWSGTEGLENSLKDHPACYAVWGKLYKMSVIGDVRFVEGKKVHEDSFFVFQIMMKKPAVILSENIVLNYRESENSASRAAFSDKYFDILYFSECKRCLVEENYPEMLELAEHISVKAHMALLRNLLKTNDKRYRFREKESINYVIRNKEHYIDSIESDLRWLFIITHHLYYVYKLAYRILRK